MYVLIHTVSTLLRVAGVCQSVVMIVQTAREKTAATTHAKCVASGPPSSPPSPTTSTYEVHAYTDPAVQVNCTSCHISGTGIVYYIIAQNGVCGHARLSPSQPMANPETARGVIVGPKLGQSLLYKLEPLEVENKNHQMR